jgi:striatin 1/3/4
MMRINVFALHKESKLKQHTYVGHSDAVWDIRSHPMASQRPILASCSADGSVKVWDTGEAARGLKSTIWFGGSRANGVGCGDQRDAPNPTSLDWVQPELTRLAVAYQNSVVKVFDIAVGTEVLTLKSDETFGTFIFIGLVF